MVDDIKPGVQADENNILESDASSDNPDEETVSSNPDEEATDPKPEADAAHDEAADEPQDNSQPEDSADGPGEDVKKDDKQAAADSEEPEPMSETEDTDSQSDDDSGPSEPQKAKETPDDDSQTESLSADDLNEPVTPAAVAAPGESIEATEPEPEAALEETSDAPAKPEEHPVSHKDKSSANMTIAIVLAILVALVLIGLGFAAYQADEEPEAAPTSQPESINTDGTDGLDTTSPVDATDIEAELNQIDESLDMIDDSELSDDGLSDETLDIQ